MKHHFLYAVPFIAAVLLFFPPAPAVSDGIIGISTFPYEHLPRQEKEVREFHVFQIPIADLPKGAFREKAEAGDMLCQYVHAAVWEREEDVQEALKWYEKAAQQGLPAAAYRLARWVESGKGPLAKDLAAAVKWYRAAAEAGDRESQFILGEYYERGLGGLPKDQAEAMKWYEKAALSLDGQAINHILNACYLAELHAKAETGDAEAIYKLGQFLYNDFYNFDLYNDRKKSLEYFQKSAEMDHLPAQYALAGAYLTGIQHSETDPPMDFNMMNSPTEFSFEIRTTELMPAEPEKGMALLQKLAEREYPPALLRIGIYHAQGKYVPRDDAEAIRLIKLAAEKGLTAAEGVLAYAYLEGFGVEKDDEKALECMMKSNCHDEPGEAEYELGSAWFSRGDYTEAVKWYTLAADAGWREAKEKLAVCHLLGWGTPQDDAAAVKLFRECLPESDMAKAMLMMCRLAGWGMSTMTVEEIEFVLSLVSSEGPWQASELTAYIPVLAFLKKDYETAAAWAEKLDGTLDDDGNAYIAMISAMGYATGKGVPRDEEKAMEIARKTLSEHDLPDATICACIGLMLARFQEPGESEIWLKKVGVISDPDFKSWLAEEIDQINGETGKKPEPFLRKFRYGGFAGEPRLDADTSVLSFLPF